MIISYLYELSHKSNKTVSQISKETGIARSTLTSLYHDKSKMIQMNTIDKLCEYFGCQPGDLLKCEQGNEHED